MIVHVMPTYACNQSCAYCYLSNEDRSGRLSLDALGRALADIGKEYDIERINVYGGEISLLESSYLAALFRTCKGVAHVSAITNYARPEITTEFPDVSWTVSVNDERPNNDTVIQKLLVREREDISLSQVVTPSVLRKGAARVLAEDSLLGSSVEFLRYSPNRQNAIWPLGNTDFENFMIDVMKLDGKYPIRIQNMNDIRACIDGTYNVYADSNIFLNPHGELQQVAFDETGEYFVSLNSVEGVREIVAREKEMFRCDCPYTDHCYAEHLQESRKGDECCGCRRLLDEARHILEEKSHDENRTAI